MTARTTEVGPISLRRSPHLVRDLGSENLAQIAQQIIEDAPQPMPAGSLQQVVPKSCHAPEVLEQIVQVRKLAQS